MSVTPINSAAERAEPDIITTAAIHLGYIKAVADLVRNGAGADRLDDLNRSTIESAMYCIAHHVDAAEEINLKIARELPDAHRSTSHG